MRVQRQHAEEIVCCGANLPAGRRIYFGSAITECFGVAGGHERSSGSPYFGVSKQFAVRECFWLAETDENEAQIMAAVSPYFVETTKREAGLLIKTISR